jgi:hypothetical protein
MQARLVLVVETADAAAETPFAENRHAIGQRPRDEDWEAVVAQTRERNPQAFAPWTKQEDQEVKRRFEQVEKMQHIARAHQRSPRAIELRLQRLGLLPPAS